MFCLRHKKNKKGELNWSSSLTLQSNKLENKTSIVTKTFTVTICNACRRNPELKIMDIYKRLAYLIETEKPEAFVIGKKE